MSSSKIYSRLNSASNLQNFLGTVTPFVHSKPVLMSGRNYDSRNARPGAEFYKMEDLWSCYEMPSACGLETPLILEDGEVISHFFIPYLSALQLYTVKSLQNSSQNDATVVKELETGTSSAYSSTDSDKILRCTSANSSREWDGKYADSSGDNLSSLTAMDRTGDLYMQYIEDGSPYRRNTLFEKIEALSKDHPGIMNLKSTDLSPASWMAVMWYPIYSFSNKPNTKDMAACFLTFHLLSPSSQGSPLTESFIEMVVDDEGAECKLNPHGDILESYAENRERWRTRDVKGSRISLPPFGMANYKLTGDLWTNEGDNDWKKLKELHGEAESWLKQYNVQHHDFNFFAARSGFSSGSGPSGSGCTK